MTHIGLLFEQGGALVDDRPDQDRLSLKAAGCTRILKAGSLADMQASLDAMTAGDGVTAVSLSSLGLPPGELVVWLSRLHQRGIEVRVLDGELLLPAGPQGEAVLQWLAGMEALRSAARSQAVKAGLARVPSKRKLTSADKAAFLQDARAMTQGALAKKWEISLSTARKYLAEWQD